MIRLLLPIAAFTLVFSSGCNSFVTPDAGEPTGLAADVATKAEEVVQQIGGPDGFGGPFMEDYYGHMAQHMGFHGPEYLADPDGNLQVEFTNGSAFPCTFHLAYIQSDAGLDEQVQEVVVNPGETFQLEIPCAEIVGVGSLTDAGSVAGELPDGTFYGNQWCVPGFLNSDFSCGDVYECALVPDTNDLDQDDDTEELIVVTSGMRLHMQAGGMGRHTWTDDGSSGGVMGGGPGSMMGGTRR